MTRYCPFCQKVNSKGSRHIYTCKQKPDHLNKNDVKFRFYQYNFPQLANKENLYNEYINNEKSLVELRSQYNLDFKSIKWLINYFQIEKRSHKQSVLKGAQKTKQTLNKNYGVENVSQLTSIKEKKEYSFLKNYGVDNIFKLKNFHDYIDQIVQERYNLTLKQLQSKKSKEVWERKTDEQKNEWLNNSIHRDDVRQKAFRNSLGYNKSKLETRVEFFLKDYNITYTSQFYLKNNERRKYFDFLIVDYDCIIEVNGDYWHANPKFYKAYDRINYPFGINKAKDVWERDNEAKKLAELNGYNVIYIWENELKEIETKEEIFNIIKEKVKNYESKIN